MNICIKDIGIILCSIYLYIRLLHLPYTKKTAAGIVCTSLALAIIVPYLDYHHPQFVLILLPFVALIFSLTERIAYDIVLNTVLISFAIGYIFFMLSAMLVVFVYVRFRFTASDTVLQVATLVVQWLLTPIPFLFPRTRKGMPFLKNRMYSLPCMILSIIVIIGSITINDGDYNSVYLAVSYIALIPVAILFYYYWRNILTKTYIDKLNTINTQTLNDSLAEKERQLDLLRADNERLSAIVHKDNKLIPAMEHAVEQYLLADDRTDNRAEGERLQAALRTLAGERQGLLQAQDLACEKIPDTGSARANHLLSYLQQKAAASQITLRVTVESGFRLPDSQSLTEDSFCTLLADLVENAYIATKQNDGRHILVQLGSVSGKPALHVFDSGVPFPTEVLIAYGKEQITTHADENGSGIGLMQTASLLQEQNASLYIEEYASGMYAKKLTVLFDHLHRYTLYTCRTDEEVALLQKRRDLILVRK